jgi:hypothetical protein
MAASASSSASPIPDEGVLNRITDRWWRIALLWLIVSGLLQYLVLEFIHPRYEAFSLLRVQPFAHELYGTAKQETVDFTTVKSYLQTQVNLITSDLVLTKALASPEIRDLSFVTKTDDPGADLRKHLDVKIVKDAYLIRVALELPNGNEAAAIINAVIDSYLAYNGEFTRGGNSMLRASLSAQREKIRNEIKLKQGELKTLLRKAKLNVIPLNDSGKQSDPTRPTFGSVTQELRDWIAHQMVETDVDVIKAQASLEAKQDAGKGENDLQYRQSLDELRLKVAGLLKQKELLAKFYERVKADSSLADDDSFEVTLVKRELDILLKSDDQLRTNLEELEFKARLEDYRVVQVDPAKPSTIPTNNDRMKYMIAAPIAVLLLLFGLFLLIPIKEGTAIQPSAKPPAQVENRD